MSDGGRRFMAVVGGLIVGLGLFWLDAAHLFGADEGNGAFFGFVAAGVGVGLLVAATIHNDARPRDRNRD